MDEMILVRLARAGLVDDHGHAVGRKAKARSCPVCRRAVMTGLSSAFGGFAVSADPQPLSPMGEALALMAGRGTFSLRWLGDHYELDKRDHFRIRGSPAGTKGIDVLVEHECAKPYGGSIPNVVTTLRDYYEHRSIPLPDEPPF